MVVSFKVIAKELKLVARVFIRAGSSKVLDASYKVFAKELKMAARVFIRVATSKVVVVVAVGVLNVAARELKVAAKMFMQVASKIIAGAFIVVRKWLVRVLWSSFCRGCVVTTTCCRVSRWDFLPSASAKVVVVAISRRLDEGAEDESRRRASVVVRGEIRFVEVVRSMS